MLAISILVAVSMITTIHVSNSSQGEPDEETVLRLGVMQKVDSLNPFIGLTDTSHILYGLLYDSLQAVGGDLESTPNLALNWEIAEEYTPYGSVWEYEITPNARWHDGEPLTADDVVFTVNLNADYYAQMWAYQPYAFYMDYAEKVDDYTVRIHFYDRATTEPMPVAYADSIFMPIVPKHLLESMTAAQIGFGWSGVFASSSPPIVGSGPFMATETIYDDLLEGDKITLVKNPYHHWAVDRDAEVRFDRVEMHFFLDETAMSMALQQGQLDVAQLPPEEYSMLKEDVLEGTVTDIETFDGPKCTQHWTHVLICMNDDGGDNPSRLDPTIRQAMTMATDKAFIVDTYYQGLADEGSTLIPPVNEEWHYEPTEEERYDFDLAAANALLEAGGYLFTPESPTVRVCTADSYAVQEGLVPEDTPLVYDMVVRQEAPEEKDIAMYLESEWAKVGIELNYRIMTEAQVGAVVYSYYYDTAIWCWSSDPDPNYMLFCQSENSWNGWNDNMYSTPEYEQNYTASVTALDLSERAEYVDNCQKIHYADAAYIILACPYQTYAWRTDTLDGWGDWAEDPGRSIDAYWGGNPFYFEAFSSDYYEPATSADLSGNEGENGWYTSNVTVTLDVDMLFFDMTPPTTAAYTSGTSGDNGWYISEISVSLLAEDISGEVVGTWYSLDGAPEEEFVEEIVIDSSGTHELEYYSVDDSDNVEDTKTRTLMVDLDDPVVTILEDDGEEYDTSEVVIEFTCDDETSGLDRCEYSLDGGDYEACEEPWVQLHGVPNGEHSIAVVAYDVAGNSAVDSLTFVVDAVIPTAARSLDYVWKDMFSHPLGSWYETRADLYGWEWPLTSEYPYLYAWEGLSTGDDWIYTFMRLNFTGRDLVELNTLSNPEFLPLLGDDSGGTAVIDWYMNYMTEEEAYATLPAPVPSWYDGWFLALNGTVTLDQAAASAVLGLPPGDFDSFGAWWVANQGAVSAEWEMWLDYEGNDRLSIYNMYEYPLTFLKFELDAEKVGDEIVVTLDTVSWGMEALMTRWLHESFMPTEWYMEDMDFHAVIGPHMADVDLDAAVAYSLFAYESLLDGTPCWAWEAMLQDYVESTLEFPDSDFDPYVDLEYLDRSPPSAWYGSSVGYDYTPGAWNLSENETLTFEWPSGELLFIVRDVGATDGLLDDTSNLTANMTVRYAMPMPFDDADVVSIDHDQRRMTFTGPFDMWSWSQEQTTHQYLADEWERLNSLPFGIPYVEFVADIEEHPLEMDVDGLSGPVLLDLPISFTVTVVNSTSQEVFTDYDGTVSFTSSDAGAMLPSDYTFVPGVDDGTHDFVVTFTSTSSEYEPHWLAVRDIGDPSLMDVEDDIIVMVSLASSSSVELGASLMSVLVPSLDSTFYRVDEGDWAVYESPFLLSEDGEHTVEFYSVDSLGTVEDVNTITVKIDKTAPSLNIVQLSGTEFAEPNITITWNCSDACSGIDRVEYSVDDGAYVVCGTDIYNAHLVNLSDGVHDISVRVYDEAGNVAEAGIEFEVILEEDDDGSSDLLGSLSALELAIVAVIVTAIIIATVLLLRRRRPSPPGGDTGEPPTP